MHKLYLQRPVAHSLRSGILPVVVEGIIHFTTEWKSGCRDLLVISNPLQWMLCQKCILFVQITLSLHCNTAENSNWVCMTSGSQGKNSCLLPCFTINTKRGKSTFRGLGVPVPVFFCIGSFRWCNKSSNLKDKTCCFSYLSFLIWVPYGWGSIVLEGFLEGCYKINWSDKLIWSWLGWGRVRESSSFWIQNNYVKIRKHCH